MRRGSLYAKARELGCNKLSLGHHYNDVIETTMLNVLYAGNFKTMLPKLKAKNFEGLQLIRPLYLVKEKDIEAWVKHNDLHFLNCACPLADKVAQEEKVSKRKEVKAIIKELKKDNPDVDEAIFRSIHNVNMSTMVGWRKKGIHHTFLEDYEEDIE